MASVNTKQLVSLSDSKSFFQIPEQGSVNVVDYTKDDAALKKKATVKKLTLNSNSKHVGGVYLGDGKSVVLISDNGDVNLWMN